jgi:hypothetical protein
MEKASKSYSPVMARVRLGVVSREDDERYRIQGAQHLAFAHGKSR